MPLTLPTTTTSTTTGSATAYGGGAPPVSVYGNATTTTYGTKTTYIPVTVNRSDYAAVYLVKRRYAFGANFRDLNDEERQELETNQGVVIVAVVDDTPAFRADVLPGDIVSAVNGIRVPNADGMSRALEASKGKETTFSLIRRGRQLDKSITLNP
ncbi:MAG: PDZ domain-containing protein [Gammaproteobacteria bacterium]